MTHVWRKASALAALALVATASAALAQGTQEVYNATASLKTAAGASVTAPVVILIKRWTTDAEREKVVGALKAGGNSALQKQVAALPDAGFIQLGEMKTPIRYARTLPVEGGKVVTVATSQPIFYVGAGVPGAKPAEKAGYDVAVAIFQVDAAGKGDTGDLAPAAKVSFDGKGALLVEDYGAEAVRLLGIVKR
jgi:ABC-type molybdate transport system substrate-binding protein